MSYVIPEGIQTKADAVLAVASVIADEDKGALGDGSVNTALDVLADVLAGQDVEVPQTNAGAIFALAQYVSGGGGAQSYPITFEEVTGGTVELQDPETLLAVTEAPAGTVLYVSVNGGSGASGGSIVCRDVDGHSMLDMVGDDFHIETYIAMPIGGITVYAELQ
ncbi:MAG: hypothetical protein J6D54_02820 [Olsenella sp.]|nr:hypothetical protein [Olsenella sp.]